MPRTICPGRVRPRTRLAQGKYSLSTSYGVSEANRSKLAFRTPLNAVEHTDGNKGPAPHTVLSDFPGHYDVRRGMPAGVPVEVMRQHAFPDAPEMGSITLHFDVPHEMSWTTTLEASVHSTGQPPYISVWDVLDRIYQEVRQEVGAEALSPYHPANQYAHAARAARGGSVVRNMDLFDWQGAVCFRGIAPHPRKAGREYIARFSARI